MRIVWAEFEALHAFCGCVILFDEVLDICGARSSSGARCHDRSYTPNCGGWDRSRLPYSAYLHGVPTVYFHGSRTGTTLHVVPALRAGGSGQHA